MAPVDFSSLPRPGERRGVGVQPGRHQYDHEGLGGLRYANLCFVNFLKIDLFSLCS